MQKHFLSFFIICLTFSLIKGCPITDTVVFSNSVEYSVTKIEGLELVVHTLPESDLVVRFVRGEHANITNTVGATGPIFLSSLSAIDSENLILFRQNDTLKGQFCSSTPLSSSPVDVASLSITSTYSAAYDSYNRGFIVAYDNNDTHVTLAFVNQDPKKSNVLEFQPEGSRPSVTHYKQHEETFVAEDQYSAVVTLFNETTLAINMINADGTFNSTIYYPVTETGHIKSFNAAFFGSNLLITHIIVDNGVETVRVGSFNTIPNVTINSEHELISSDNTTFQSVSVAVDPEGQKVLYVTEESTIETNHILSAFVSYGNVVDNTTEFQNVTIGTGFAPSAVYDKNNGNFFVYFLYSNEGANFTLRYSEVCNITAPTNSSGTVDTSSSSSSSSPTNTTVDTSSTATVTDSSSASNDTTSSSSGNDSAVTAIAPTDDSNNQGGDKDDDNNSKKYVAGIIIAIIIIAIIIVASVFIVRHIRRESKQNKNAKFNTLEAELEETERNRQAFGSDVEDFA